MSATRHDILGLWLAYGRLAACIRNLVFGRILDIDYPVSGKIAIWYIPTGVGVGQCCDVSLFCCLACLMPARTCGSTWTVLKMFIVCVRIYMHVEWEKVCWRTNWRRTWMLSLGHSLLHQHGKSRPTVLPLWEWECDSMLWLHGLSRYPDPVCCPVVSSRWPLVWKTWKFQWFWQLWGKCQEF